MNRGIRTMTAGHYDDLLRLSYLSTSEVKGIWDDFLDDIYSDIASIEAVHEDLNRRGEGDYCAV